MERCNRFADAYRERFTGRCTQSAGHSGCHTVKDHHGSLTGITHTVSEQGAAQFVVQAERSLPLAEILAIRADRQRARFEQEGIIR